MLLCVRRRGIGRLFERYIKLILAVSFCSVAAFARSDATDQLRDRAATALSRKQFDEAIALYSTLIQQTPGDAQLFVHRAEAYSEKHDVARAVEDLTEAIRLKPARGSTYLIRAAEYESTNEFEKALTDCDEAILRDPSSIDAHVDRARIYGKLKHFDDAIKDANYVLARNGHHAKALFLRASAYSLKHADAEAMDDIEEFLLIEGDRSPSFYMRAKAHANLGQFDIAAQDFEQALRITPKNSSLLNSVAWFFATCPDAAQRNAKRAIALATKAVEAHPDNSAYLDTQAAAFAADGQFELAVKAQEAAVDRAKDDKREEMRARLADYQHGKSYTEPLDWEKVRWDQRRFETFDLVWKTVNEHYFDPAAGGGDWRVIRDKYRLPISNVANDQELRTVLRTMLGELHRSHFAIIPRSEAVFLPEERVRQGTAGLRLAAAGEQIVVSSVEPNSRAEQAQLLPGDVVTAVEGYKLDEAFKNLTADALSPQRAGLYLKQALEARLSGPVDSPIHLTVVDAQGKSRDVELRLAKFEGIWSDPVGNFSSLPVQIETKQLADKIGYVRFNVFALPVVKPLKNFFRSCDGDAGLIIDLRGNPGGALMIASGLCGWLCDREATLGRVRTRYEEFALDVYPQERAFLGPIAVLIDATSGSASELFAAGLRGIGRARLFGSVTAGAVLPSLTRQLPNGDLFQYAVGDIIAGNGKSLESVGVEPDLSVEAVRDDFVHGRDPVLESAKAWLNEQRGVAKPDAQTLR